MAPLPPTLSMPDFNIILPSKPRVVKEEGFSGVYEIDGLYPGYGHTLGNSLRRIILSSLPGAAITGIKLNGVEHEFSTIPGVKEDVVTIILNLKRVRIAMHSDEAQNVTISAKGIKTVTAESIEHPGQITILNPEQHIATLTEKSSELIVEMKVEKGLGYIPKEILQKDRVEIGQITLDAIFSPIRRVNYEVENMRVGNRTDFNRLKLSIETDGSLTPKEALEKSISVMISQLKAIVGFEEEAPVSESAEAEQSAEENAVPKREIDTELLKTRIETIGLTQRTSNALSSANIRTLGGLVRKKEEDILDIDGLGTKGVQEIKKVLSGMGITLK
ncbi:MAG: DNA-directed RNA polymerase subunit alpha [bacterium]|nr:DNA-directed RNA polymerase subunit alpha [bacterium]